MLGIHITLVSSLFFANLRSTAVSSLFHRRQTTPTRIDQYITDVKTALYVIASINAGTATISCADSNLSVDLEKEGYDGGYAQELLCEEAVGIEIFPNLNQAYEDMTNALNGLLNAQSHADATSRLSSCRALNVGTLDDAGLDGSAIQGAICNSAGPSSVVSSSANSNGTSSRQATTGASGTGPISIMNSSSTSPTFVHVSIGSVMNTAYSGSVTSQNVNSTTARAISSTPSLSASDGTSNFTRTATGPSTYTVSPVRALNKTSISASMPFSRTLTSALPLFTSSSTLNTSSQPVTTVTVVQTTWIDKPPLSFAVSASNSMNGTTITIDVTITLTVAIATTVTLKASSTSKQHGPWHRHGPWQSPCQPWHRKPGISGQGKTSSVA